jgi:hypothetical protein
VTTIVSLTWSNTADAEKLSVPQKLSAKTLGSSVTAANTMNTRIGTILATVTIRFITAASLTPRAINTAKIQIPAEDNNAAAIVSPSPSAGHAFPIVDMMNTQ